MEEEGKGNVTKVKENVNARGRYKEDESYEKT